MSHERDHDHPPPAIVPPREPEPLGSNPKPDRQRPEHPTILPREPVDPLPHPSRRLRAPPPRAHPA